MCSEFVFMSVFENFKAPVSDLVKFMPHPHARAKILQRQIITSRKNSTSEELTIRQWYWYCQCVWEDVLVKLRRALWGILWRWLHSRQRSSCELRGSGPTSYWLPQTKDLTVIGWCTGHLDGCLEGWGETKVAEITQKRISFCHLQQQHKTITTN